MNWTDKLKEILSWVASHSQRLSRKGLDLPNHLVYARIYLAPSEAYSNEGLTVSHPMPIELDGQGKLQSNIFLKPETLYRLEVRDSEDEILFTEDNIKPT